MDSERKVIEINKKDHESTQENGFPGRDGPAEASAPPLSDSSGANALPATGRTWWRTIGAATLVVWAFMVVLFYMVRFVASVGDAGARGIYGL
jgi:hypothetical protein